MVRDFREMEASVRSWVAFLHQGEQHYRSAKSSHPDPLRMNGRTAATSSPGNRRCLLLQLACFVRDLGSVRGEILIKRCTRYDRRAKSAEAAFEQIAADYPGMSTETCKAFYRAAIQRFYVLLVDHDYADTPYDDIREPIREHCAAQEWGDSITGEQLPCAIA